MSNNQPVHEIRLGGIKAAIWENETPNGLRFNIQLVRLFKDGDNWKQTTSFSREDLPLLVKIADRAHS